METVKEKKEWIVYGKLSKDGSQYKVQCPYCDDEHRHGASPGHRWAHCDNRGNESRGYTIVPETDK